MKAMTTPTKFTPPTIIPIIAPRPSLGEEDEASGTDGDPTKDDGDGELPSAVVPTRVTLAGGWDLEVVRVTLVVLLSPDPVEGADTVVDVVVGLMGGGGTIKEKMEAILASGTPVIIASHRAVSCGYPYISTH